MNCPAHPARPLVTEHTSGKLFCIACRLPVRRARYMTVSWTDKTAAVKQKQREYSAARYKSRKVVENV